MPVLVDTSVWIDFFHGHPTPAVAQLKNLLGQDEILLGDLILAEILQGVREHEVARVEKAFAAFRVVPLVGETVARQSASAYRTLRSRGVTVRKTIDCLIATWCIRNRTPLLHDDRDFLPFVQLGLVDANPGQPTLSV
jgi:hypothetical protein